MALIPCLWAHNALIWKVVVFRLDEFSGSRKHYISENEVLKWYNKTRVPNLVFLLTPVTVTSAKVRF
jgi:hypothetical protein